MISLKHPLAALQSVVRGALREGLISTSGMANQPINPQSKRAGDGQGETVLTIMRPPSSLPLPSSLPPPNTEILPLDTEAAAAPSSSLAAKPPPPPRLEFRQ